MNLKIYQVDAFTNKLFGGNPAAVCRLEKWLSDGTLQNIAAENNLAETAFYIKTNQGFHIRWFTPKSEVNLCGHATLATAFVLFEHEGYDKDVISFESRSGILTVTRNENWLTLNFPVDTIEQIEMNQDFAFCFDKSAIEIYKGKDDFMMVFSSQDDIETLKPNLLNIAKFQSRGIIVTAKGNEVDFVSRYFAPAFGIDEDPVTGSAHTTLMPYWTKLLNKNTLIARQISERQGYLKCTLINDRVEISGQAVLYLKGEIFINQN
jgi:PhzF family phenazine biosynthesis protein